MDLYDALESKCIEGGTFMNEKQWLKKAIQAILSQDKSDNEKAEEILEMFENLSIDMKEE